ncbi:hypothetical protein VHEMI09894 [[Torrubiella] hemipterigena]|uniref:Uncharacterized protein n=1 Tax=[Torrubiella] hemipterigena TaxID=1531966 RepID=A0A0A1TSB5_9HYPO|nr:hypothetical protein VHEMI09894 [[Torrubiella] hemipterigena]
MFNIKLIVTTTSNPFIFIWKWSVPYKNRNRDTDIQYAKIWKFGVDKQSLRENILSCFPDIQLDTMSLDEEYIRRLVLKRFLHQNHIKDNKEQQHAEIDSDLPNKAKAGEMMQLAPEETWECIPEGLRNTLASLNAIHIEEKLNILKARAYHTPHGRASLSRALNSIRKVFQIWRLGFANAVSRTERVGVNIFFVFLAFCAVYPDIAAGFLGERSYNQRSIGGRVVTLFQLFFLWMYPYHPFLLLFTWSLERLLGAFVGNTVYALAAVIPSLRLVHSEVWFRTMMLVLSLSWQIGVQFAITVRDYTLRLLVRRQMRLHRQNTTSQEGINWAEADKEIAWELLSLEDFITIGSQSIDGDLTWDQVPIKVRIERYVKFTSTYRLGRPADQLISLLKDDMEAILAVYEDYRLSSKQIREPESDKSFAEPRFPKLLLVCIAVAVFTYVCYSFWPQPFTFNTIVAYSTVVIIKQMILAFKRYQTVKSALRLFTNMVSINILGMLLVSTPVTADPKVLQNNVNMVLLTLAMVFSTLFLAELIAPLLLLVIEYIILSCGVWYTAR